MKKPKQKTKTNNIENIKTKVYNFKTKYKEGFIDSELKKLLNNYSDIDMDKFNDAMMGNTSILSDNNDIIYYHCDIFNALLCGIQKRNLTVSEWD